MKASRLVSSNTVQSLAEDGTPVLALLSDEVWLVIHEAIFQKSAQKVLTIAEENVAKEGDDIVLIRPPIFVTNLYGGTDTAHYGNLAP